MKNARKKILRSVLAYLWPDPNRAFVSHAQMDENVNSTTTKIAKQGIQSKPPKIAFLKHSGRCNIDVFLLQVSKNYGNAKAGIFPA